MWLDDMCIKCDKKICWWFPFFLFLVHKKIVFPKNFFNIEFPRPQISPTRQFYSFVPGAPSSYCQFLKKRTTILQFFFPYCLNQILKQYHRISTDAMVVFPLACKSFYITFIVTFPTVAYHPLWLTLIYSETIFHHHHRLPQHSFDGTASASSSTPSSSSVPWLPSCSIIMVITFLIILVVHAGHYLMSEWSGWGGSKCRCRETLHDWQYPRHTLMASASSSPPFIITMTSIIISIIFIIIVIINSLSTFNKANQH